MKKIFLMALLAASLFSSEYSVDVEKSSIKFEVSKFLFIGVDGEFSNFSGTIVLEDNKLSKIEGVVFVNSINTENEDRDTDLKKDDYFSLVKFPNIVFSSTSIENDILNAKVTIKGIEKELSFKISDILISSENVSFSLSSTVDRQEFMLNGAMSAVIADNVDVVAKITAMKK